MIVTESDGHAVRGYPGIANRGYCQTSYARITTCTSIDKPMVAWLKRENDPPDARSVMPRVIILKYVFVKGLATPPPEYIAACKARWSKEESSQFVEQGRSQNGQFVERLRESRLWDVMEPEEHRFMLTVPTQMTHQMLVDASWRVESILCLLWALGYVSKLPPYDEQADSGLANNLPQESAAVLIGNATLRPRDLITSQRDIAELWHWRSRTRKLQESGRTFNLPDGMTMENVLQKTSARCAADGLIPTPLGADFPAFGKAYRELTREEYSQATSIATERHFTFNWLCGRAPENRWEKTPTDT